MRTTAPATRHQAVDEALKSGRIVQADHDMRVDQLRGAQTMQDIDLAVRDLRAPGAGSAADDRAGGADGHGRAARRRAAVAAGQLRPGGRAWRDRHRGRRRHGRQGRQGDRRDHRRDHPGRGRRADRRRGHRLRRRPRLLPRLRRASGPTDDTTYLPGQAPGKSGVNVHTVEGYNDMVDALREETGATYAFTAVLYPRYAVLEVPTGTNNRYQNFYWDGEELELKDIKGTTDDGQVDLSLVDPQQMIDMLNLVRGRLDNPENWYVIIGDSFGAGPQISAYASNDFGESTLHHREPRRHRHLRLRGASP